MRKQNQVDWLRRARREALAERRVGRDVADGAAPRASLSSKRTFRREDALASARPAFVSRSVT